MVDGPGPKPSAGLPRAADEGCAPDDSTSAATRRSAPADSLTSAAGASGGTTSDDLQFTQSAATAAVLRHDAIPGYTLMRELHRGGQGVVYQAVQLSTRRQVAIKVMREGPFASAAERTRFHREVQLLAQLNHPHIVTIHDSGQAADVAYFVMDYIPGQALDAWCQAAGPRGRPVTELVRVFAQICGAVHAAHQRGIVHRDLKPSNIRVDPDGEPHVLDFGLAKAAAAEGADLAPLPVTITGHFMGSLPWASPEQAEAQPSRIDLRSDVYSLGVVFYQMLTGRFPYDVTGGMTEILDRIRHATPLAPRALRGDLDHELETIVLTCLHKDRDRRYASAGALADDLARYLAGEPVAARRDSLVYLARNRARKFTRRYPGSAYALVLGTSVLLTLVWPGVPLVYRWTPANRSFERLVVGELTRRAGALDHVRVIAAAPETDAQRLAAAAGLAPDALPTDYRALRAVHGALLERLALAEPAVVGFDVAFTGASEHDAAFVRGVQALRAGPRPCPVVVAAKEWTSVTGHPETSPAIAAVTRWGCSPSGLGGGGAWSVYLALARGVAEPVPSLVLSMLAALRRPEHEVDVRFDEAHQALLLVYWQSAAGPHGRRVTEERGDRVRATDINRERRDAPEFGIRADDLVARYRVPALTDATLHAATHDYAAVLSAAPEELRRDFGGKAVLVCNWRAGPPPVRTPDGRFVRGSYAHATALELLVTQTGLRVLSRWQNLLCTTLIALVGLLLGVRCARRAGRRVLLLAATAAVLVAASGWAALHAGVLFHPLIALLALITTAELGAATQRLRRT